MSKLIDVCQNRVPKIVFQFVSFELFFTRKTKRMDSSDEEMIPESILEAAAAANVGLLPAIFRGRYEKQFEDVLNWRQKKSTVIKKKFPWHIS